MGPSIQIANGKYFNFLEPYNVTYDIRSVAHSLSMLCRFTGHVRRFYSVAQHSVLVSKLVPPEHAYAALMHEVAESVMNDISSPLKQMLNEYKSLEHKVEVSASLEFGFRYPFHPCIKEADHIALVTERDQLMPAGAKHAKEWEWTKDIKPLNKKIWPMPATIAKYMFLFRYCQLTSKRND